MNKIKKKLVKRDKILFIFVNLSFPMFLFEEQFIFDINVFNYFKYSQYVLKEKVIFTKIIIGAFLSKWGKKMMKD